MHAGEANYIIFKINWDFIASNAAVVDSHAHKVNVVCFIRVFNKLYYLYGGVYTL